LFWVRLRLRLLAGGFVSLDNFCLVEELEGSKTGVKRRLGEEIDDIVIETEV